MLVARRPAKRVPLRNRNGLTIGYALVDARDYNRVMSAGRWSLSDGYAHRRTQKSNKSTKVYLHRFILDLSPEDPRVDHRDRNPLNNQRSNLRRCTQAQNSQNQGLRADNTSGHRGVRWHKAARKWAAEAKVGNTRYHVGLFLTKEAANEAITIWRHEHMPFSREVLTK